MPVSVKSGAAWSTFAFFAVPVALCIAFSAIRSRSWRCLFAPENFIAAMLVTAVSGSLSGYQDGASGYTGVGSTAIDWVWLNGLDFNPSPTKVATFLMNGNDVTDYTNWITFAYDLTAAPALLLAPGGLSYGFVINVNYNDILVKGSLTVPDLSEVPLPSSLLLLMSGLVGIASLGRMRAKVL